MRPYLAIIKDSFREALASRVLWILLILITLGLAALAPLGFRTELTTEFRQGDFRNARAMARDMMRQYDAGKPSPGFRIVSNLDEDARKSLTAFGSDENGRGSSFSKDLQPIIDDLNGLLSQSDLYQEEDWQDVLLGSEARELLERGPEKLSEIELSRLNRLLIEVPYDEHFRPQPPKQIVLTYFGAGFTPPIRASEGRVKQVVEQYVIPGFISMFVGVVGVFIAILVTASIIPQMFDPGSLSLLLSKPISRSLMFLAKFVGGCAFILINVTYLTLGLWVIIGLRLDIWNEGLLWCIPIFLFLFAIYYSVSALAGVVWRNAIICVVMAVLFWGACFVVGVTKGFFDAFMVEPQKIVTLVQAGDKLISVDEVGGASFWNEESNEWEETFIQGMFGAMRRVLGPVYDAENKMLLASASNPRGLFRSGNPLILGKESDGWMEVDGPTLPDSTFELLPDPKGRLLAITYSGVYRLAADFESKKKLKVFFLELPQSIGKPFRSAGPETALKLNAPAVAAVDPQNANVAVYSRGTLMLLTEADGKYSLAKSVQVDAEEDRGAAISIGGSTIVLALEDGRVLNYRAPDLQLRAESEPEPASQVRFAQVSPNGKWFALVFHSGRLHLVNNQDADKPVMQLADVRGQGDISAALLSPDDTILVVDRVKRVNEYQLGSFELRKSFAPGMTGMEMAYYYVAAPIYKVFPKPGELDTTAQYLLKKEETVDNTLQGDLQAKRTRIRPWAPVRSSMVFMLVVLLIACIYIERQDF